MSLSRLSFVQRTCITLRKASSKLRLIPSFSVGFIAVIAYDETEMNGYHSTRKAIVGGGLDFEPEDITSCVSIAKPKKSSILVSRGVRRNRRRSGLINAIGGRMKKTTSKLVVVPYMLWIALLSSHPLGLDFGQSFSNIMANLV